ncbi:hypothetical protein IM807_01360 [Mycoplasma sp. 'Moose RK']|nr:hypothetical protein [Mycoplasma sp. 'Moose RK']MBG0730741.1 hypothetical protein [Mycoplasma sp. 'Moose RK']
MDSKTIQKWINRLGSSNCDFDGSCESKWISLDQYQEQIYYKEQDIDNLNDKYAEFDFNMPEKEMDETTKKALEEYFEASEKIIDYYDVNLENEEKILKNKWIKIQNGILDFEFGEYAKNDAECLEKILLSNEKIIKGHIDTVYSAFSRLEPLSNFNLVDNIIQKNWKDYPNFFEFNNGEYGFEKLATDVITGKLKTNETEILGFRSETDTLSQVQKETKKLKMKM